MELDKALQLPVKSKESIIRFIIGGLLDIIPIANLLSSGYAFLFMRRLILEGPTEEIPEWDNWGTLFKYGILTFLISLGYSIIPIVIFGLGIAAVHPQIALLKFIGVTLLVLGGACFLAAFFLLPMGLILFAIEGEFSSAFAFTRIIDMTIKHIGPYFKAFIILLVIGIVLGLISNIPLIGWIVGVFVGFYLLLETSLLMGAVGREILAEHAE